MFQLRAAVPEDSGAVFALAREFATSFVVEETAFREAFAELLGAPHARICVALSSEEIAGYLLGFDHPAFYANGRVAWVEEVMVHAECRGRGVGRMLMGAFEEWARARGCKLVALATRRASAFYMALGYEESAAYFRKML
jgi:GNAT superfamily N-acetyltransferase